MPMPRLDAGAHRFTFVLVVHADQPLHDVWFFPGEPTICLPSACFWLWTAFAHMSLSLWWLGFDAKKAGGHISASLGEAADRQVTPFALKIAMVVMSGGG